MCEGLRRHSIGNELLMHLDCFPVLRPCGRSRQYKLRAVGQHSSNILQSRDRSEVLKTSSPASPFAVQYSSRTYLNAQGNMYVLLYCASIIIDRIGFLGLITSIKTSKHLSLASVRGFRKFAFPSLKTALWLQGTLVPRVCSSNSSLRRLTRAKCISHRSIWDI